MVHRSKTTVNNYLILQKSWVHFRKWHFPSKLLLFKMLQTNPIQFNPIQTKLNEMDCNFVKKEWLWKVLMKSVSKANVAIKLDLEERRNNKKLNIWKMTDRLSFLCTLLYTVRNNKQSFVFEISSCNFNPWITFTLAQKKNDLELLILVAFLFISLFIFKLNSVGVAVCTVAGCGVVLIYLYLPFKYVSTQK